MNSFAALLIPLAALAPAMPVPLRLLEEARRPAIENQVRIEQRVIIRIAPSSPQRMEQSLARLNRGSARFKEERLGECIPINMIAGVAPQESRLLLFMRDRRILSARLERACNPEDFYAGFYIERQDGRLCERRDRLQSRAGASCRVTRLSRLVPARD
jgi:hypothetical protein